ncbi:uncharacterized protein BJ171DRAFT_595366 [Polychytrium aggregatum]|uniref:uncharacterized protein n=1 Tax=Polychytrium aggregatum TaxID=110093 RepID=UPI0022FDFA62|nr:uncharacterized protein BJ171DRAFT_595366 [Polychytrium aggregatum]KAI9208926.1 hypothetical protein BJ171DRAFT_595366 [Polychytrium aggregatum]
MTGSPIQAEADQLAPFITLTEAMKEKNDVVSRLTDTSKYTGSHKERFAADGTGKGLAGRQNIVVNDGSTSSAARNHEVTDSGSNSNLKRAGSKPVAKPKTNEETYGVTPPKILLFQYADKNHAGEKLVLTKQKYPTFKQLYFSLTRRRRFKRLDLYGKRQRTVHEMCKQVIDQAPRETEVVCSHCREAKRLEKVEHLDIEKPHFVRSCASCHTLWDRDINASRNMISITPPGKPKLILDRSLKEIKPLDEILDGERYLVVTSADRAKIDESKIPSAFKA